MPGSSATEFSCTILLAHFLPPDYDSFRMDKLTAAPSLSFETHPTRYRHWKLEVDGDLGRLTLDVEPFGGIDPEIELKSNSRIGCIME